MAALQPCLLVVDDEQTIRSLLVRVLKRGGYENVRTACSDEEARDLLAVGDIDLVLSDVQMPGSSGLQLLNYMHDQLPGIATLMVTGVDDATLADKALALGAYGYIIKPFRQSEVLIGVSNALRRRALELENQNQRDELQETVELRTVELSDAIVRLELSEKSLLISRTETIERLAVAGEFRDEETGVHVARMSRYCEILARRCGDEELQRAMREASSLHDVGKIGIPDSILLKPGALTPEERTAMEAHAEIGHRILRESASPLLRLAAEIALTHHEKVDGSGYPQGLAGDQIPQAGRIAGIADVFDALTSNRVYRPAFSVEEAVEMMTKDAGAHFEPHLLSMFWDVLPEVLEVKAEYGPEGLAVDERPVDVPVP